MYLSSFVGDSSSKAYFADVPINLNGTYFNHLYSAPGVYSVVVTCQNAFSTSSATKTHRVQHAISGNFSPFPQILLIFSRRSTRLKDATAILQIWLPGFFFQLFFHTIFFIYIKNGTLCSGKQKN
jgi:hypothetical protein